MCGIIGVAGKSQINHYMHDGLTLLQHRGQDSAGITTFHNNRFVMQKGEGLISNIFGPKEMDSLIGEIGIGHVRYPTAGNPGILESQPFYVNSPYGIMFAHNGNITNVDALKKWLYETDRRHLNTDSDSELLLNLFAHALQVIAEPLPTIKGIFSGVDLINKHAKGGYACVSIVVGVGLVAFRDPNGIRPLVLGKRETEKGTEYMVASESIALDITGFELLRDVRPVSYTHLTLPTNREV